jgi:uncharacterized membrane protein
MMIPTGTTRVAVITISAVSAAAMLYVGAYQMRLVEHMSCPLLKHGCEAVADAPFARPFGIPDGLIAAALYALLIIVALFGAEAVWARYALRGLTIVAALANVLGVYDMSRFGAYCFYCLLTTVLSPVLVWLAILY